MAQLTGTQILALARLKAQDQQASVIDADALTMLNDILLWWQADIEPARQTTVANVCTVAANSSDVIITDTTIEDILALHPASSASLTYPLQTPLQRVDPEEIWNRYQLYQNASNNPQQSTQWVMWGAERDTDNPDEWHVFFWPQVTSQSFATLRVTKRATITALGNTPDISYRAANIVSSLLGYQLARLQKQNDQDWLNGILFGVPKNILDNWMGQARMAGATQGYLRDGGRIAT